MKRALLLIPLVALAGCAGSRAPTFTTERFSNTIWEEVCAGATPERAYLRFLPDGTFAWSTDGLAPGDFRHDGDDRWGVAGEALIVTWDGGAETTQYREGETPGVLAGSSTRPCGRTARLEPVE
jgi:hypothetical protein